MSVKKLECKHDHWEIQGHNRAIPPHGTCLDCDTQVLLHILLNRSQERLEEAIKKLEKV